MLSSPRPTRRKYDEVPFGPPSKRQKCSTIITTVPAPSPARSWASVEDDEENEQCTQVHVEITRLDYEERVNDLTGGKTKVDWYKVVIGNASNNICVDPDDGVKVWAKYGEPMKCAYKNIEDLMKNLLKDHSRHCVAGEGVYHGLTGVWRRARHV
jgi:hypothetical protein